MRSLLPPSRAPRNGTVSGVLTTVHLHRVRPGAVPAALWRMALDRGRLRATPGVRFAKLVGTGDGRTFDLRDADLRTWGMVTVWEAPQALAAFERTSPVARAWARLAEASWRADLRLLSSRGTWAGMEPFGPEDAQGHISGTVVGLTRARLRWTRMPGFWRAVPPVVADLGRQPGLVASLGIGEAPFGLQGTLSLWRSEQDLRSFAYAGAAHRQAIRGTVQHGWYAEELFARFALVQQTGSLHDVLADRDGTPT